jgi:predicted amidohydrolase
MSGRLPSDAGTILVTRVELVEFVGPQIAPWIVSNIARTRERSVPVVRADVTGRVDGLESYGTSAIVDHRGVLVTTAEPFRVELLVAEIDAPARSVDPPSCTSPGTLA